MRPFPTLWKANLIVFSSSFCVMVIELTAARILAPYIGVSLYTWTSIIGVILGGIALGNYLGGKMADRYTSPLVLVAIFLAGSLATIAILPATRMVAPAEWPIILPVMLEFVIKVSGIFLLPAVILSMVSPVVIKLTLADLGRTGGVVGTIYAFSTVGAILGTFLTGFYFILWFGTRTTIWVVAAVLLLTGLLAWFAWRVPNRWKLSLKNFIIWGAILNVLLTAVFLFQFRVSWQEKYTGESNYYTIQVRNTGGGLKALILDDLVHSYVIPDQPAALKYGYLNIFTEIIQYVSRENPKPRVLHLGGGGYSLPRYMEVAYSGSVNEVIEIDPMVTEVAHQELGLPLETSIKTYNQDARLFLLRRKAAEGYDIVIGDVFNDKATPYHLTTLEFDRLVRANMKEGGIYLVNIIDNYKRGRYMPSFIYTLKQVFDYVYLFSIRKTWQDVGTTTFVIAATDRPIDLADYQQSVTAGGRRTADGNPHDETGLEDYLAARKPILLTDDHAPTDILVLPLFR